MVTLNFRVRIGVRGNANSCHQRLAPLGAPPSPFFRLSMLFLFRGGTLDYQVHLDFYSRFAP